jgi:hypothetical protein
MPTSVFSKGDQNGAFFESGLIIIYIKKALQIIYKKKRIYNNLINMIKVIHFISSS